MGCMVTLKVAPSKIKGHQRQRVEHVKWRISTCTAASSLKSEGNKEAR